MIRTLYLLVLVCLISGCSIRPKDVTEPHLVVNIQAASNINPNTEGKPSPVVLRIYELADSQAFEQADFVHLYNDEQKTLKDSLLLVRHLPSVMPDKSSQQVLPLASGTKYIGVIAGFANYHDAKNKVIYQPMILRSTAINIELDGINLSVTGEREE
ncbi:type VI secretion system lipoprotein TssJ [Vibrio sp. S4M6]|uniref:type VI secretion system lipoprotein TssJ n=1 Tax=Vibrio sinus TaxID=2946865 RepID=UPI002029EC22|nr:type VI secretion system lipoprotein TssJ [Vibrio sinus]MCL9781230.1 type VI secretion system lipoprotein TssJ [Vibrio sinus]